MSRQNGQSLVEILLASALLIILMPAIFAGILVTREGRAQQKQRIDASYLLKQTQEEVRIIRERGWTLFANSGTYHPEKTNDTWTFAAGPEDIRGFTRQVVVGDVYRDETGVISEVGNFDPSTRLVEVTVSWNEPFSSSIQSAYYLTRYLDNLAYTETTENDFLLGETSGTVVVNSVDGEVMLGAGGQGDWCNPLNAVVEEIDLPKQGVANAISGVEGQVIAGTGENASGVSLAKVSIDNNDPPNAIITGEFDGYKTNDVFTEVNYAYIATDTNQKEVVIISIANTPFAEVGFLDLPGSADAGAIYVIDQVGFVLQDNKFWSFDLSSKAGLRPLLDADGVSLAGNGTEVIVVGNYAYISLIGNIELQIVDVSDPTNLNVVAQADVNGNDGRDIAVNSTGTRSYLATSNGNGIPEFFIIDTSSKTGNQAVLGSFDTGDMDPRAIIIVPGNKAIIAGYGGNQYQVINIIQDNNPNLCGQLTLSSDVNDLVAILEADGDAYTYVLTKDSSSELKIIEGGPGGQYSNEGTFESSIFDANYSTVFNRFQITDSRPTSTEIKYQMAAADAVDGSCVGITYSYVGPDRTNTTFFTDSGAIPLDDDGMGFENPAQCFRYKIYFSSDVSMLTPIFEEISINYSP